MVASREHLADTGGHLTARWIEMAENFTIVPMIRSQDEAQVNEARVCLSHRSFQNVLQLKCMCL